MFRARRVSSPLIHGTSILDHSCLEPVLGALQLGGVPVPALVEDDLRRYLAAADTVHPATLSRPEALAFWLNLYNAGALEMATRAFKDGAESVLRVPGAFDAPMFTVAGEQLSLDDVEHGKIRRFGDPRIHAALVCGSVSCPTLRYEPYRGDQLDAQLDDQLRRFLAGGGAVLDQDRRRVHLSRVFLWYGGDFTRPDHMPTWLPARSSKLLGALRPWLDESASWIDSGRASVRFQNYDWGLRCSVG